MAGSLNKVQLIGHLGRDPEVRQTSQGADMSSGGGKIVHLSIATTESWKDKNTGERKDRTEWHRVVVFNENLATIAEKYLRKGSKIYVEGQLQTRKWTDAGGQERYTTEVILSRFKGEMVLLDSRSGSDSSLSHDGYGESPSMPSYGGAPQVGSSSSSSSASKDVFDDDIPF